MYDNKKPNKISKTYAAKTHRKIEFFGNEYPFIALFPKDLDNGYAGVHEKMKLLGKEV